MKTIKTLELIKTIIAILILLIFALKYIHVFPSLTPELMDDLSRVFIIVYLCLTMIISVKWSFLYKEEHKKVKLAESTMQTINDLITYKDIKIQELETDLRTYESVNNEYLAINSERIALLIAMQNHGKLVAITTDSDIYYSFDVKKEAGLIVTRKEKNKSDKIAKNEKVPAKFGIDVDGIVYVLSNGELVPFKAYTDVIKSI